MKTIEEKAKAYDSIIEKANKMHSENCEACKACIEELIPELAESEDERIRKELVSFLEICQDTRLVGNRDREKWIAWLERQGEKHPDPYNGISFEYNGHIWGMCARDNGVDISCDKHLIKHLEKQGEQIDFANKEYWRGYREGKKEILDKYAEIEKQGEKPADSYCQENCKGFQETGKCFADGECKAKRESDQKPEENKGNIGGISPNSAWSEEDERMFNSCCAAVAAADYYTLDDKQDIENWLQSLQNRVQPQPKQEWSEEDEEMLDSICISINEESIAEALRSRGDSYSIEDLKTIRSKQINWLKSIRPMKRWKPSDEQMGCLSDAIEHYNSLGYPAPKLKELLDDLKKLRGKV